MKDLCAVVIPRYKKDLDEYELISLQQCINVLNRYPIYYISPKSLFDYYQKSNIKNVIYFDDNWFMTSRSYSSLLLTKEFYYEFSNYKYILIYQLDAFVFKDDLDKYCNKGYDYIGAPMHSFYFYRAWSLIRDSGYVGNGGVSLRKISSFIRGLDYLDEVYERIGLEQDGYLAEDSFFSFLGLSKKYSFDVPDIDEALEFAIEYDVNEAFCRVKSGKMPFAVHGWSKNQYKDFWAKYINVFGYNIAFSNYNYREQYFESWIKYRFAFCLFYNLVQKKLCKLGFLVKDIVIWGAGVHGRECFDLLRLDNIIPVDIYDNNPRGYLREIIVTKPFTHISKYKEILIIITPKNGKEAICEQIEEYRGSCNIRYIYFNEYIYHKIEEYYEKDLWTLYQEMHSRWNYGLEI